MPLCGRGRIRIRTGKCTVRDEHLHKYERYMSLYIASYSVCIITDLRHVTAIHMQVHRKVYSEAQHSTPIVGLWKSDWRVTLWTGSTYEVLYYVYAHTIPTYIVHAIHAMDTCGICGSDNHPFITRAVCQIDVNRPNNSCMHSAKSRPGAFGKFLPRPPVRMLKRPKSQAIRRGGIGIRGSRCDKHSTFGYPH